MSFEFDEKGKFFTEVVAKVAVTTLIQTTSQLIRGSVHIRPDQRLKDELDREESFLAVTAASILDANGNALYTTDFLAVRRDQIIWVMPEDEQVTEKSK